MEWVSNGFSILSFTQQPPADKRPLQQKLIRHYLLCNSEIIDIESIDK